MAADEDEAVVVVAEQVSITVTPVSNVTPPPSTRSSWVGFWIVGALVGILAVTLVWFPSSPFRLLSLILVQKQNKLWGVKTNDTIVPEGADVCRRAPG